MHERRTMGQSQRIIDAVNDVKMAIKAAERQVGEVERCLERDNREHGKSAAINLIASAINLKNQSEDLKTHIIGFSPCDCD